MWSRDSNNAHLAGLLEHADAFGDVAEEERVVEARHGVVLHRVLGDLEHLAQVVRVSREQVEEREALHVPGLLVRHLDDLRSWSGMECNRSLQMTEISSRNLDETVVLSTDALISIT